MDNSNLSNNRQNAYLGVNKIGKNIRKSPLHQPDFSDSNAKSNINHGVIGSSPARQQSQPQVYNISKSDFRSIVQQLTGSHSQNDPLPIPPSNPPKNTNMRLQRIRPPPLTPINCPRMPAVVVSQPPLLPQPHGQPQARFSDNNSGRPPPQFGQPAARGEASWTTPALSPISAYMQQLQSCIGEGGQRPGQQQMQGGVPGQHHLQVHGYMPTQPPILQQGPRRGLVQPPLQPQAPGQFQAQHPMNPQAHGYVQTQPPMNPQGPGHFHAQHPSTGLLPNPNVSPMPSPGVSGPGLLPLPSPGVSGPGLLPLPSPGVSGPGLLPSPTSQLLLSSPSGYFNFPSPHSPYPLLSPGSQFPPPLSPNFAFSPFGQHGILGSGPPQPPLSPGISFPPSPSGFFPLLSPRWRDQ